MEHEIWHKEADGHFSAEVPGLKLVVRKSENCARYVILQCAGSGRSCVEVMLSSGTESNVDAAIAAARKAATRIDIMLTERRRAAIQMDHRSRSILADANVERPMADRFHILIVEDDPLIVDVMVASLELEYRVSSVNTVGAALASLRTSHVDVVLVDTVLPDGRGTEVAGFANDLGAVVIEMSGYPQVIEDLERSERLYLLKPFGVQVLLSTIGHALHKLSRADARPTSNIDATTSAGGTP